MKSLPARFMRLPTPIGLDLGTSQIKAAQASPTGKGLDWRTAVIPRDQPGVPFTSREFGRITGALRRNGFSGSKVVLGTPRDAVRASTLDLPANQPDALRRASARAELGQMHQIDPSGFELLTWPSPQPPRATPVDRLLALVCPHDDANVLLDGAEAAGLAPVALTPASLGLAMALNNTPGVTVVVDLGWTGAAVVGLRDRRPFYERVLNGTSLAKLCEQPIGNETLDSASAAWAIGAGRATHPGVALAVAPLIARYVEAVATQLRASMTYLSQCMPDERITAVTAIGGPTGDAELLGLLEDQSGIQVRPWEDRSAGPNAQLVSLAQGLALLGASEATRGERREAAA
ncbi:MAG: hypothetical protein AAGI53_08155 [Planctomycetota bacterium]